MAGQAWPSTRESLLVRLRAGTDHAAWRSFVNLYAPMVHRYAQRRGLQAADCEEVVQEVFLRVSKSIGRFEYNRSIGRFRSWLGTIAGREVTRLCEKRGRAVSTTDGVHHESGSTDPVWTDEFHARLLDSAMERCRARFSAPIWEHFERTWVGHEDVTDVAESRGVGRHVVYQARSRVLARLQEELRVLAADFGLEL